MNKQEIADRFFNGDLEFANSINLTKEEVEIFEKQEWTEYNYSGMRHINGGYTKITIYDLDDSAEDGEPCTLLDVEFETGEQDCGDGQRSSWKWKISFNRKTQKFETR